ncbi:MAG: hypothetical protein CL758_08845 [Chloroflexi bacterium]|nr:hypothetical protein [Chloroflexota bacterium]|tara:strand:+ start:1007 stop:1747 length:741 start_codon:yes stop_codon:yes gene_type:complete
MGRDNMVEVFFKSKIKKGTHVIFSADKSTPRVRWKQGIVENVVEGPEEGNQGIFLIKTTTKEMGYVREILKNNLSEENIKNIIQNGEDDYVEFKETFRVNAFTKEKEEGLRYEVLKEIAAFMNTYGGTILIGVKDDKEVVGVEPDFKLLGPKVRDLEDEFSRKIFSYIEPKLKITKLNDYVRIFFKKIDGKNICVILVTKAENHIFVDRDIQIQDFRGNWKPSDPQQVYYRRVGNSVKIVNIRDLF